MCFIFKQISFFLLQRYPILVYYETEMYGTYPCTIVISVMDSMISIQHIHTGIYKENQINSNGGHETNWKVGRSYFVVCLLSSSNRIGIYWFFSEKTERALVDYYREKSFRRSATRASTGVWWWSALSPRRSCFLRYFFPAFRKREISLVYDS